jgi:hypothetical protein
MLKLASLGRIRAIHSWFGLNYHGKLLFEAIGCWKKEPPDVYTLILARYRFVASLLFGFLPFFFPFRL